jgi:hypothetical protein
MFKGVKLLFIFFVFFDLFVYFVLYMNIISKLLKIPFIVCETNLKKFILRVSKLFTIPVMGLFSSHGDLEVE